MELKTQRKFLRRAFNPVGWTLVVYYILMNVVVVAVSQADLALRMVSEGRMLDEDALYEAVMGNGWGYLLTIAIGLFILVGWKGSRYISHELCKRGRPMTAGSFFSLLFIFLSGQTVFQIVIIVVEMVLNGFGLSVMESVENASVSADTLSMFLYMGVGAPIAEELLFRGVIMRTLEPFGKKFAIVMSAFLFGIYHGNIVQAPFAFVIGLVLGYTAIEYNVTWAMLLHMINNLVLADMLGRLTAPLGDIGSGLLLWLILIASTIAAIVVLVKNRYTIRVYAMQHRMNRLHVSAFFTNSGVIVLMLLMCLSMVLFFFV